MKNKNVKQKKGFEPDGELIGNSNTGVLHYPGCRAIPMMNPSHKVLTNGAHFRACGWCHGHGRGLDKQLDYFSVDLPETEIVNDPKIISIFKEGCLSCHSTQGDVKMYPHSDGYKLLGKQGTWWIYFDCEHCGYETALWKAKALRDGHKTLSVEGASECKV